MSTSIVPSLPVSSMSSVEIAELTGKRHDNVVRDLRELESQGVIGLLSFEELKEIKDLDGHGKGARTIYNLPKRETLILTSGYSAKQRATIIDRWLELEAQVAQSAIAIPQTLPEALRLAADLADKVAEQTAKLIEQQPKADFHDRVTQSEDLLTIREAAKVLRTGERRLFEFLRKEGMLMRSNLPYQDFMNRDLFRVVETPWTDAYDRERISTKTCLTQKGLAYVRLLQDKLALFAE